MGALQSALLREHQEIDTGIETFMASLDRGIVDAAPLRSAFAALRRHIYLEEEFLFPPIKQAGVLMAVLVMVREHGTIWRLMDEISDLLGDSGHDDIGEPISAKCRELLTALDRHNSKEEPIIYPHADTDLSPQAAAELADFMASGTMPEGWTCEAVR